MVGTETPRCFHNVPFQGNRGSPLPNDQNNPSQHTRTVPSVGLIETGPTCEGLVHHGYLTGRSEKAKMPGLGRAIETAQGSGPLEPPSRQEKAALTSL